MRRIEVEPNGENATDQDLAVAMEAAPNRRSYVRLGVIRALLLGLPRGQVAQLYNRSDRMIRLWVHQFNEAGIDALISGPRSGRPRLASLKRIEDLLIPVLKDPSMAGRVHWTGITLHGYLKEKLSIDLGYRTAIRWLHEMNVNLRVPRPWPERQDEKKREQFLESMKKLQAQPKVEFWFSDECGIEGDPRPRRRWVQRGSRPKVPYRGDHIRQNVIGAVCPDSGALFSIIVNGVDTDVFQIFLDEMAKVVAPKPGYTQILILDNASWHKASRLNWHHFQPMFLPPYSPDYNPIERFWLRLKSDWFTDFIAQSTQELSDRIVEAIQSFLNNPNQVASACSFRN